MVVVVVAAGVVQSIAHVSSGLVRWVVLVSGPLGWRLARVRIFGGGCSVLEVQGPGRRQSGRLLTAVVCVASLLHLLLEVSFIPGAVEVRVGGRVSVPRDCLQGSQQDLAIVIDLHTTRVAAELVRISSRAPGCLGVSVFLDVVERILSHKVVSRDPLGTLEPTAAPFRRTVRIEVILRPEVFASLLVVISVRCEHVVDSGLLAARLEVARGALLPSLRACVVHLSSHLVCDVIALGESFLHLFHHVLESLQGFMEGLGL